MRKAVVETLCSASGETVNITDSEKLRPDLYLSGMQAIGLKADGQLLPAGPLEIIASGGLNEEQLEQIGEVTVLQSHIASLYDTLMDVEPRGGDRNREKQEIAGLVNEAVGSKIVNISMS
jgi:hypothetical protein